MKNNTTALSNGNGVAKVSMKAQIDTWIIALGVTVLGLLFVGLLFLLFGRVQTTMEKAGTKMDAQNVMLDESAYVDYDGAIVSGTEVVSFIKAHANDEICVTVNNGHSTTSYIYDSVDLTTKTGVGNIAQAQNKANLSTVYINPNSNYLGEVVRDAVDATNGTIVGVNFTIQTN